jgi:CDP-paratose 2-epimerase
VGSAYLVEELLATFSRYQHHALDMRDRQGVRDLLRHERPDFIVHAAAQPSHDKAAAIPYDDFDVNAMGTPESLGGRARLLQGYSMLFHQH